MSERLRSDIFADSIRRACERQGAFVTICTKGHPSAGIIWISLRLGNGLIHLYTETLTSPHKGGWQLHLVSEEEAKIDAAIGKQRAFDDDMWIIEIEGILPDTLNDFQR